MVDAAGEFLKAVEATQMTKSFKMLTLLAMLNRNAIPGGISIADLMSEFRRIARRSDKLRADVGNALENDGQLRTLILENPIAAWCGGLGTGGTKYFRYDGSTLESVLSVPPEYHDDFQNLLREIVDWRLAEYLQRGDSEQPGGFASKVIHADSRPIVKLPNRSKAVGIPEGWTEVTIDGRVHVANFAKEFINVVRTDRESETNVLGDILRSWFGPDAGMPGTRRSRRANTVGLSRTIGRSASKFIFSSGVRKSRMAKARPLSTAGRSNSRVGRESSRSRSSGTCARKCLGRYKQFSSAIHTITRTRGSAHLGVN
ncbi:MAG: hypothetical protein U1A77_10310 [Pirellulales bacterium]